MVSVRNSNLTNQFRPNSISGSKMLPGKNIGNKSGSVYMKGTKYRISAPGQEIFSDGSNVWTYEKSSNEVTISKIDPAANSITPQKLFTNFYDKDFLYKLNGPVKINNKTLQEIELTPIDKTKAFHKVLVYIDKSVISTTKVFEKTGNRYTYSVSNMNTSAAIADPTFVFNELIFQAWKWLIFDNCSKVKNPHHFLHFIFNSSFPPSECIDRYPGQVDTVNHRGGGFFNSGWTAVKGWRCRANDPSPPG